MLAVDFTCLKQGINTRWRLVMSVEERLLYGPGLRHHPASLDGLNKLLTICF